MIKNFEANISALKEISPTLCEKIQSLEGNSKFKLTQTKDNTIEIFDTINQINISSEKDNISHLFECEKYKEHPFLYIFGISDTSILINLLENKTHRRIVLIEPELELLYIALHLYDFSSHIYNKRLRLFLLQDLNTEEYVALFNALNARFYVKTYTLLLTSSYYSNMFQDEIKQVSQECVNALKFVFTFAGNDIRDSMVGIEHTITNLPLMLSNPSLFDLKNAASKKETAVIVSTGPSLFKQLPLLEKIQDYVTIISVDASLPILEKHNIIPDIVASIERIELTSTFFENVSQDYLKKIVSVHAVLQHKTLTDFTTNTPRVFFLRPLDYNQYFNFPQYGYIGGGLSSANLAHDIAFTIGVKNCILIGQDLAYAKDGKSHAKGHVLGEDEIKHKKDDFYVPAYGGEGKVLTHHIWKTFLTRIEQAATFYEKEGMQTINSTEGGARIEYTKELSFAEAIKQYISQDEKKTHIKLEKPDDETVISLDARAKEMIDTILEEGENLQKQVEKSFLFLADTITPFETLVLDEIRLKLDDKLIISLLDEIEKIRKVISSNTVYKAFMLQTIESMLLPVEIELATVKSKLVTSPEENQLKAIQWIFIHKGFLFKFAGAIHNILEIIKLNNPYEDNKKEIEEEK